MGCNLTTNDIEHSDDISEKIGYVLMLDVLGFKEYISKTGPTEFVKHWKDLKNEIMHQCSVLTNDKNSDCVIDAMFLSDTIVVCFSNTLGNTNSSEELISKVPSVIDRIFLPSFVSRCFFRGALSFGKFICDKDNNIAMGEAINEAYEWHESTDWIGVILSPSAKYVVDRLLMIEPIGGEIEKEISQAFMLYPVPFKNKLGFSTYVYKWVTKSPSNTSNGDELINLLETLSHLSFSPSVTMKYENTLEFINTVLDIDIDLYRRDNTRNLEALNSISQEDNP